MKKILLILLIFSVQQFFCQKVKSQPAKENKMTEQKFELSKDQIKLFDASFRKFIAALQISDRKAMENMLSPEAKKMITENVYKRLSEDIRFTSDLEIFKTGYKSLIGGGNQPMIQYKYADEKTQNPNEIITAVFKDDGKIIGIKPYKQVK